MNSVPEVVDTAEATHAALPDLVRRAAEALAGAETAAEVLEARDRAALAYDTAKRAGRLAKAKDAHDSVVAAVHRAQADALEIEAGAKRRLADEYDQAQDCGEVGKKGQRTDLVPDGNKVPTAEDVGLSRKGVFEARQIRDAIIQDPDIVRRTLDELVDTGDEPTRAALKRAFSPVAAEPGRENLRAAIGTDTASHEERGNNLYETPPEAVHALLALERFGFVVWEPACGRGAISQLLGEAGREVILTDLIDYGTANQHGEVQEVGDFLNTRRTKDGIRGDWRGAIAWAIEDSAPGEPDIITNPPYGPALNAFVAHALREHRPRKMALLLNLNFLCGSEDADRNFALDECPPARIHVFTRRLPMMHRDGWTGPEATSRMNTAWFVWEQVEDGGYCGRREVHRIDWKDYQDKPALATIETAPALPSTSADSASSAAFEPPPLRWREDYPGGRQLAFSGKLEIGAVFPPHSPREKWSWRLFVGSFSDTVDRHSVADESAARAGLVRAWLAHLAKAGFAVAVPRAPKKPKRRRKGATA